MMVCKIQLLLIKGMVRRGQRLRGACAQVSCNPPPPVLTTFQSIDFQGWNFSCLVFAWRKICFGKLVGNKSLRFVQCVFVVRSRTRTAWYRRLRWWAKRVNAARGGVNIAEIMVSRLTFYCPGHAAAPRPFPAAKRWLLLRNH